MQQDVGAPERLTPEKIAQIEAALRKGQRVELVMGKHEVLVFRVSRSNITHEHE